MIPSRHGCRRLAVLGHSPQSAALAVEDQEGGFEPAKIPRPFILTITAVSYSYGEYRIVVSKTCQSEGRPSTGRSGSHKPLLLLIVLELAEQDLLEGLLPRSPELAFRFLTFWHIVAHRRKQRPDILMAFGLHVVKAAGHLPTSALPDMPC